MVILGIAAKKRSFDLNRNGHRTFQYEHMRGRKMIVPEKGFIGQSQHIVQTLSSAQQAYYHLIKLL